MGLSCLSFLPLKLAEPRRKGLPSAREHRFTSLSMWAQTYFPQHVSTDICKSWEEGEKIAMAEFLPLSEDNCNILHPRLFFNMTLVPPQRKTEPTRSPRLEEYGRSEVCPTLTWPGVFCLLPLKTPTLEMIPPRTSPPCCETSKKMYRTLVDSHPRPPTMWGSPLRSPVHSSLLMPAAPATIWPQLQKQPHVKAIQLSPFNKNMREDKLLF